MDSAPKGDESRSARYSGIATSRCIRAQKHLPLTIARPRSGAAHALPAWLTLAHLPGNKQITSSYSMAEEGVVKASGMKACGSGRYSAKPMLPSRTTGGTVFGVITTAEGAAEGSIRNKR